MNIKIIFTKLLTIQKNIQQERLNILDKINILDKKKYSFWAKLFKKDLKEKIEKERYLEIYTDLDKIIQDINFLNYNWERFLNYLNKEDNYLTEKDYNILKNEFLNILNKLIKKLENINYILNYSLVSDDIFKLKVILNNVDFKNTLDPKLRYNNKDYLDIKKYHSQEEIIILAILNEEDYSNYQNKALKYLHYSKLEKEKDNYYKEYDEQLINNDYESLNGLLNNIIKTSLKDNLNLNELILYYSNLSTLKNSFDKVLLRKLYKDILILLSMNKDLDYEQSNQKILELKLLNEVINKEDN